MAGKYVDDCGGIKIGAVEDAMKELSKSKSPAKKSNSSKKKPKRK